MIDEPLGSERGHRCVDCSGVFIAGHIFKEIRAHSALHLHKHSNGIATTEQARITCPNDSKQMVALIYKGIEIDVCPSCHGVWLDPSELEKILKLVKLPEQTDLAKINSKMDEIDQHIDIVDSLTDMDVSGLGDVVGFIGDAIGSVFDGISF